ncbi:MAG: S-methyl-5-thioribose-1-phosphate isomerase [Bacillota bacterium]
MGHLQSIEWRDGILRLLDQTRLPAELVYLDCRTYRDVVTAINRLSVRGAPALGVAGAFALVLAAREAWVTGEDVPDFVQKAAAELRATRPTAVNLGWALDRLLAAVEKARPEEFEALLLAEAQSILAEEHRADIAIGCHGQALLADGDAVLTHCNTGSLATTGIGTALGVIRAAVEAGKRIHVFVDETRPLLQGARLTMTELLAEGIPATLICDNMAAALMRRRRIAAVLVGADRIAKNGDVANKIGTYGLAVLARYHGIPFYVAAPLSTYDPAIPCGEEIPIEERDPEEVRRIGGVLVAPAAAPVWNPAFDVTPVELITGIITEYGVARGEIGRILAGWYDRRI